MEPIDFGTVGILQIGDERYGFRPLEFRTEYGHAPIMRGEFLPDMFAASNYVRKSDRYSRDPQIKNVYFNDPVTVVIWSDGSKTIVRCQPGDTYSKETGLALCIAKKYLGNKGNFNEVFKQWIPEETEPVDKIEEISVKEMRCCLAEHCWCRHCSDCLIAESIPDHRCGNGTQFFSKKPDGSYDMTDDEIRDAFKVAFK